MPTHNEQEHYGLLHRQRHGDNARIVARPAIDLCEEWVTGSCRSGSVHSRRPRNRSCDSMMWSASCARFKPGRPLLEWPVYSLAIRRSAARTRSRARSKSVMLYCRGSGRVRFPRGPFAGLLARTTALSCFAVATGLLHFPTSIVLLKHIRRGFARESR